MVSTEFPEKLLLALYNQQVRKAFTATMVVWSPFALKRGMGQDWQAWRLVSKLEES